MSDIRNPFHGLFFGVKTSATSPWSHTLLSGGAVTISNRRAVETIPVCAASVVSTMRSAVLLPTWVDEPLQPTALRIVDPTTKGKSRNTLSQPRRYYRQSSIRQSTITTTNLQASCFIVSLCRKQISLFLQNQRQSINNRPSLQQFHKQVV